MEMPNTISAIAIIIRNNWKNIYFGAVPYLQAMFQLENINDMYGQDNARSIINYFLANAGSWRGEIARDVKKKLKDLLKQ